MNSRNIFLSKGTLTFLIMAQGFCTLLGSELPQPVQALVEKRQSAISKINVTFIQELEKLKINYTKAGDLEKANLIVALINQTKQSDPKSGLSQDAFDTGEPLTDELVGKWMIYDTNSPKTWSGVITITKTLHYSCQGAFGTNNNQGGEGKVAFKEGNKSVIIGPYEFTTSRISSGKIFTTNYRPRTMERIK